MDSTERIWKEKKNKGAAMCPSIINWRLKKLVWKGYKNTLTEDDLRNTETAPGTKEIGEELQRNWSAEVSASQTCGREPSLARAVARTYARDFCLLAVPLVIEAVFLRLAICYLGGSLLAAISPEGAVGRRGALACVGELAAAILLRTLLNDHHLRAAARLGARARAACSLLLYRKALQRRGGPAQPERMVSLLSGAAARLEVSTSVLHWLWLLHVQAAAGGALLYHVLGLAGALGLAAVYVAFAPAQALLARVLLRLRRSVAPHTEARTRLVAELVAGVAAVKANAWEPVFQAAIQAARRSEMSRVAMEAMISGFSKSSVIMVDRLAVFATLLLCTLFGYRMVASKIFTAVLFYFDFKVSLAVSFPAAASAWSECKLAVENMQKFLLEEDGAANSQQVVPVAEAELPVGAVEAREANFRWTCDGPDVLEGISFSLPPGSLCAVVGPVASGKTSLLMALLGELRASGGRASVSGATSLSPQEAWVFSGSARHNVVLGGGERQPDADPGRYGAVLAACALPGDLRRLPRGDETPVGERGARLSGGQSARLALARAAYQDADVYLLDDPLSAVDPHVASHVFRECILKLLAGKTRLLVTHQLNLLPLCDHIIVLNKGRIEFQGRFNEIQENYQVLTNIISLSATGGHILEEADDEEAESEATALEAEDLPWSEQRAAPSWRLLWAYLRAGSGPLGLTGLVAWLVVSQAVAHGAIYWVVIWSDLEAGGRPRPPQWLLLGVQGGLSLANVFLLGARAALLVRLALRTARALHDGAAGALLAAPLPFYQRCPAAALAAHCSEHVATVDRALPPSLVFATQLMQRIWTRWTVCGSDLETAGPLRTSQWLLLGPRSMDS
ncbi:ATP-binding cassette sub-family C member 4-like [Schistocerca americana]|uniref:ATP-binding cassette sub-family C member 4-like n=1 Tax=Schistocerca americana TaxID=7009 RepID=UPI001F4F59FE|nr:ATP-binding cassette sub-family C member 4-like [Schistocerca americana]